MCTNSAIFLTLPPAQCREWRAWPVEPTRRLQTTTAVQRVPGYIGAPHRAGQPRRWACRATHATTTLRDPAAKLVPSSSSHAAVLLALLLMHTALRAASVSPPLHAGFHEACRLVQARTPLSMDVESAHTGSGQTSYVVFRGPLRRDRIFENTHYGHNKRMTGWIVVCKEQNHCALSLRSLRFQHTQTLCTFTTVTTVTALSTHAQNATK
jgi:hypothetical protein